MPDPRFPGEQHEGLQEHAEVGRRPHVPVDETEQRRRCIEEPGVARKLRQAC